MSDEQPKKQDAPVSSEAETVVPGNNPAAASGLKMPVPKIDISDLFGPQPTGVDALSPLTKKENDTPNLELETKSMSGQEESAPIDPEFDDKTPMPSNLGSEYTPSMSPNFNAPVISSGNAPVVSSPAPEAVSSEEASTPSFAKGGAGAQAVIMNLPDPNSKKEEAPAEPQNEQEAQTQIVGKANDPSIFESATVIRPSDVSMSEVTQYLKDLKGKSLLHENKEMVTPFGEAPQFERRSTERERRGDSRRKGGRRGSDTSGGGDLFGMGGRVKKSPAWIVGVVGTTVIIIFFLVSTFNRAPEKKIEKASVVKHVSEEDAPVMDSVEVASQLKVEFLSDLHKNIEATKAHAPMY